MKLLARLSIAAILSCAPGFAAEPVPGTGSAKDKPAPPAGEAKTPPQPSAEPKGDEHLKNPLANPKDNPALPRVLIIGDSISIGYTVPVRKLLQDKANVHRPPTNCAHSAVGLKSLESWLGQGKWDVIHFNWGIWDTHLLDKKTGQLIGNEDKADPEQVRVRHTPEQYRENLVKLVNILKGTGAKLIWASTTPIMSRTGDRLKVIPQYNEVAAAVMKENGVEVDDLCSFVLPEIAKWQSGDKCHFGALGNQSLGDKVGKCILEALAAKGKAGQETKPASDSGAAKETPGKGTEPPAPPPPAKP
jgi:acyl-CoA thioesterase-1